MQAEPANFSKDDSAARKLCGLGKPGKRPAPKTQSRVISRTGCAAFARSVGAGLFFIGWLIACAREARERGEAVEQG